MANVIDFDAFRSEQDEKQAELRQVSVKIGGVDYPLSPSLPAVVVLDIIRLKNDLTDEDAANLDVSAEMAATIGEAIFGKEAWRNILITHQIGIERLPDLIRLAMSAYIDDPKARAQMLGTNPSLSDLLNPGLSSNQTSAESTESTS